MEQKISGVRYIDSIYPMVDDASHALVAFFSRDFTASSNYINVFEMRCAVLTPFETKAVALMGLLMQICLGVAIMCKHSEAERHQN